ncbi:MAG TPA: glycosyltransferase [Terriglobales bacterium]|nr:glycosyltransferase [Terriglobales bacterium]
MKSMHVAMIDPSLFTLPYDTYLCNGLVEAGVAITLYGRRLRRGEAIASPKFSFCPFFYSFSERLNGKGGVPRPLRNSFKLVEHISDTARLAVAINAAPPDLIHYQWMPAPLIDQLAIRQLKRRGIPVVMTVHDTTPFNDAPTSQGQNLGWKANLELFDCLIVHTEQSKTTLEQMGIRTAIATVPHGVLSFGAAPTPVPRGGKLRLLFFGGIKPYKGLDVLLRAFAKLKQTHPAELRIVGNCPEGPAELESLIDSLGIRSSTRLECRFFDDAEIPEMLSEADLVIFPYRRIDSSGALLTALAYVKPFIASDVGIFRELMKDRSGLVPPGDVDALAAKLQELVDEPSKIERLTNIALEARSEIPSWEQIGALTASVYERVLRERGAR